MTALEVVVPTERSRVLRLLAAAVWDCGTTDMIRAGMAAQAMAMPALTTQETRTNCQAAEVGRRPDA